MVERSPVELVIKAVQALPEADRDRALAWLVERNSGSQFPPGIFSRRLGEYGSLHGEHQSVLVRLPVAQHTRLREWCNKHGFSMATVVRGLVDRFLDQQAPGDEARAG